MQLYHRGCSCFAPPEACGHLQCGQRAAAGRWRRQRWHRHWHWGVHRHHRSCDPVSRDDQLWRADDIQHTRRHVSWPRNRQHWMSGLPTGRRAVAAVRREVNGCSTKLCNCAAAAPPPSLHSNHKARAGSSLALYTMRDIVAPRTAELYMQSPQTAEAFLLFCSHAAYRRYASLK
jgi:hypothetical protein